MFPAPIFIVDINRHVEGTPVRFKSDLIGKV
jgi:hypothetical protein